MNIEAKMNELGVNAILGTKLMDWLSLYPDDLLFNENLYKLQDIINYLKPFSEDSQRFMIRKITTGKQVDKLRFVHEWVELMNKKDGLEKKLNNLKNESDFFVSTKSTDNQRYEQILSEGSDLSTEIEHINQELSYYEK